MYKWISFTRRLLRLLYQYCFVLLIYAIIYSAFQAPFPDFGWFAYLFGALAVSYTFREMCSRGLYLFLIHIAMSVPIWFVTDDLYIRLLVTFTIIEYFADGQRYISKGYELKRMFDVPWESFVVGIAAVLLGLYMKDHTLMVLGYLIPVATIFIYIIAVYFEGLEDYLNTSKHVTGAPMKQIVSVNTIIIAGIICIALALLVLSDVLNLEVIAADFFKTIIVVLKIIFTFIYIIFEMILAFLMGGGSFKVSKFKKIKSMAEDAGLLANVLQTIMFIAFACFIIYLIVKLVSWFIRLIIAKHRNDFEVVEEIYAGDRGIKKEKIKREKRPLFNDPVHKARHIYKKKVLSYKSIFVPAKENTAGDIDKMMIRNSEFLDHSMGEALQADHSMNEALQADHPIDKTVQGDSQINDESITKLYEAVRYGDVIPDSKYLKKMKNAK